MTISSFKSKFAKAFLVFAVFGLMVFSSAFNVNAQSTNFAQFFERFGTNDFIFTNNTASADFNTISGGSQIFFLYQGISGLDPSLQGIQNARMIVTTTTTTPATIVSGNLTQPLNQTVTIQVIRDTAAPVGSGTRRNLLTAVFSPSATTPAFSGSEGGNSATFSATTPDHIVTFTSDFIAFGLTTQRNLGFSFSALNPSFSLGSGNFAQSFTAAASGTFASSPVPVVLPPTAAGVSVSGRVMTSNGGGLRGVSVVLTETDGTTHRTTTNLLGNYEFPSVAAGQTVTISASSRRYSFSSQVVSLQENVTDLNFVTD